MVLKKMVNCTGCGCCAAFCPSQCLDMRLNDEGFYCTVLTDSEQCNGCNLCEKVCPVIGAGTAQKNPKAFSAVVNDKETLMSVTSGGACYEIAKIALTQGYKICAVIYNYKKHNAEHVIITDIEELEETKGSKYMQSYTVEAFRQLFDGSKYAVFGTPCQIAGIEKYAAMKNMRENFLLIDLFCHGVPSMRLWQKYIGEKGENKISGIHFRSKEYRWHTSAIKINYTDGTCIIDSENNLFNTFFLRNYCLNTSCYKCPYKALNSNADIRAGDFWGSKYDDVETGISSVLAFTLSGLRFIKELKKTCKVTDEIIDDAIEGQMFDSPAKPIYRRLVLRCLGTGITLYSIYRFILFPFRVYRKILSFIKKVSLKI